MAAPDPSVVGILPGTLYLQPGGGFTETQWGLDEGSFTWETHVSTPRTSYPRVNDSAILLFPLIGFSKMFVTQVVDTLDESTKIVKITAKLTGSMNPGAVKKEKITPSVDTSVFNLPTLESEDPGAARINVVARVPKLSVTREYVTTTQPTYSGVSETYSASFLPSLPSFTITFLPDPDEPQTINYSTGWKLDNRTWEPVSNAVWHVREIINYYWNLAV